MAWGCNGKRGRMAWGIVIQWIELDRGGVIVRVFSCTGVEGVECYSTHKHWLVSIHLAVSCSAAHCDCS